MTGTMPRGGDACRAAAAAALAAMALAGLAIAPAPAAASTVALVDRGANQNELGLVFRADRGADAEAAALCRSSLAGGE